MRKSLGRQLKALRLAAGKTVPDVVASRIASKSKLQIIENGKRPVKLADAWALCRLYGCDQATTDRIAEMALNLSTGGWWEDYGDALPTWFSMYVELEAAASVALMYDPELVPGLLQSPTYQRAQFETYPGFTEDYVQRQILMRSERQRAVLERKSPLALTVVIGQEALTRLVGGEKGLAEQKAHLREMCLQPSISLSVLPWSAGAHLANKGAFNILDFDGSDDPSVVYLETYVGGRYVEDEKMLREFRQMFATVNAVSVPIEEFLQ